MPKTWSPGCVGRFSALLDSRIADSKEIGLAHLHDSDDLNLVFA